MTDTASSPDTPAAANFVRDLVRADIEQGTFGGRVQTRFPPEPNGYLHIGHAKAIVVDFGIAAEFGGVCKLRFDDTNPITEDTEYVDAIVDDVRWLGFEPTGDPVYASDYFEQLYQWAEHLIGEGLAYVDDQDGETISAQRGGYGKPGVESPFRIRSVEENLSLFRRMRAGEFTDGSHVLRAKIDMQHENMQLRDPIMYRIRHEHHHRTGDTWCIYPMYDFAHGQSDSIEHITHSICTLEFEDQRPFYDWLLGHLEAGGLIQSPPPRQYEFARLNLTFVVTSKRKLAQLVSEGHVRGWDDPRMPTIVGLRRRGYTPESLQLFAERIGVTKSDSWIDYSTLEGCLREDLEAQAARAMAVLEPLKLVLTNWDEVMGAGVTDTCSAPVHPHHPERGQRNFKIGREVWIERTDYEETPPKGFFRLFPAYWLSIPVLALVAMTRGQFFDAATFLGNLTMMQGFWGGTNIGPGYWTLNFEMAFYLLCAFLFWRGWLKDAALVSALVESMLSDTEVAIVLMSEKLGHEDVYDHALNVMLLSLMLAKELQAPPEAARLMGLGALFHDVGKADVPEHILRKTLPLTKAELNALHEHCNYGVAIGRKLGLSPEGLAIIEQHHEHVDGSGYPKGLKGPQLSMFSKIVAVANAYDNQCNPTNPANRSGLKASAKAQPAMIKQPAQKIPEASARVGAWALSAAQL